LIPNRNENYPMKKKQVNSFSLIRIMIRVLSFGCFCLGFLNAGIGFSSADEIKTVRVVGSTTVAPIAARAAEAFSKKNPGIRIVVNGGGSGVGINAVGRGLAEIGMASRHVTDKEKKNFASVHLTDHIVGRDGVACAISSEIFNAGVNQLTREQIADIYSGIIKSWKAVGGPDRPILVIDKEKHRGTRHVFMGYVFNDVNARAQGAKLVTGSNNEERSKIAQSDSAVGMLSAAWLNADVKGLALESGNAFVSPTVENIQSGKYPVIRDLLFITAGEPKGILKDFIDFVRGEAGRSIVTESGYVFVPGS
jgi:phosphate transport system substrate-binding protein